MKAVIITSTLLGIAAIFIRKLFGNRVGIKPFIIMWAVVFIKFALPFELPSPLSVMNLFSEKAVTETIYENPIEYSKSENTVENLTEQSQSDINIPQKITEAPKYEQDETESDFDLSEFAETVYFLITETLLFCIVFAYIIFTIKFHRLPRLENELCKKIIAEFGIKRKISVHSGKIDTPAVFGVLFPVIILPENTAVEDNEKLIRHIMLHEICHIKHFDTLWNIITLMICAINWYNPIVWICRYMYLADTEKLCDMNVLKLIGDENRREYANSLLEYAVSRQNPVTLISGFGEGGIKSRIKCILSIKKVRIITVISAAAVIITAAFIFGTGKSISVSTGETVSKTSDTGELWYFSQMLEDDEGEAGKLVPISADVDTTDNIYYKYETTGYDFSYTAELVKAKGSYFIRSVNPLTGAYYGSCELPIEKLPKDIESCFKFSSGLFFAEAVIVYSPPADNSPSENHLYNATFIVFDDKGKPQIADIIGNDGSRLEELQISDSFTSESGFMNDSYLSHNGKVNLRMERTNNTIQIIDMVYNDDNYRTLEKLDPKLGGTENDTAQTTLYNADGTIIKNCLL